MPRLELPLDGPFDLVSTLAPLVRGQGDRTIRLASDRAWLTTRTAAGPATIGFEPAGGRLAVETWGPGADQVIGRLPRLLGPGPWSLVDAPDIAVARLARRHRGVRILRTESILDTLIAAIVEQKVTGTEAHRVWHGLVRLHGEPAPGPPELGLRVFPAPATLARLPYWAYHELGLERRRAELIRAIAARPATFEGIVDLSLAAAQARLLAVPGIGPWTVAEVAVRALGDVDAVSVGDFHLPHLVTWALAGEPRGDDARMLALLEPYRGRRALVVRLLELSGLRAPRYGARLAPRRIEQI
ncbi:MAG: DNA-3-methyladenine glycosylase family protein [Candidatus Limnocylindrales bacterium]